METYEQVRSQLGSLYEELSALAKKTPDAPINRFKLQIVNEKIRSANGLLSGIHRPFESFLQFDEAELPTASDVVVVLSQYVNALEGWRSQNLIRFNNSWYWNTKDRDQIATSPPSRLRQSGNN